MRKEEIPVVNIENKKPTQLDSREIVGPMRVISLPSCDKGTLSLDQSHAESKKIGVEDEIRALYAILRHSGRHASLPMQFFLYVFVGGTAAIFNVCAFIVLLHSGLGSTPSVAIAYFLAAVLNYIMCIFLLFRHKARWNTAKELTIFMLVVAAVGALDIAVTKALILLGLPALYAKSLSCFAGLLFNFLGRRYLVFPERALVREPRVESLQDSDLEPVIVRVSEL